MDSCFTKDRIDDSSHAAVKAESIYPLRSFVVRDKFSGIKLSRNRLRGAVFTCWAMPASSPAKLPRVAPTSSYDRNHLTTDIRHQDLGTTSLQI